MIKKIVGGGVQNYVPSIRKKGECCHLEESILLVRKEVDAVSIHRDRL